MARWNRTGSATVTNGSATVTGTLTAWLSTVKPADSITFDGGVTWYEAAAVNSNTSLTLGSNYAGSSGTITGASGLFAINNTSPAWSRAGDLAYSYAQILERLALYPQPVPGDAGKLARVNSGSSGYELVAQYDAIAALVREKLTAPRTYYASTTGSDANDGLSVGAPKTLQGAVNAALALDTSGHDTTIQLADGTYAKVVIPRALAGGGVLTLRGNTSISGAVFIASTELYTPGVQATGAAVNLRSVTMSGHIGVTASAGARVTIDAGCGFGACTYAHIYADGGGTVFGRAPYYIAGGAFFHIIAVDNGYVDVSAVAVTLAGNPVFTGSYICAARGSYVAYYLNTFTGSAVGTRYLSSAGSGIFVNGGGASYLPGNAAGSADTASGGWYA